MGEQRRHGEDRRKWPPTWIEDWIKEAKDDDGHSVDQSSIGDLAHSGSKRPCLKAYIGADHTTAALAAIIQRIDAAATDNTIILDPVELTGEALLGCVDPGLSIILKELSLTENANTLEGTRRVCQVGLDAIQGRRKLIAFGLLT